MRHLRSHFKVLPVPSGSDRPGDSTSSRPDEVGSWSKWAYFGTPRPHLEAGSHRTWPARLSASLMLPELSLSDPWPYISATDSWVDLPMRLVMRCSIRALRVS